MIHMMERPALLWQTTLVLIEPKSKIEKRRCQSGRTNPTKTQPFPHRKRGGKASPTPILAHVLDHDPARDLLASSPRGGIQNPQSKIQNCRCPFGTNPQSKIENLKSKITSGCPNRLAPFVD